MKYKLTYVPFIWITTALLGSALYYLVFFILGNKGGVYGSTFVEKVEMYLLSVGIALIFSLPSVVIFWFVMASLVKGKMSTLNIKHVLASVAMVLILLTWVFMGANPYGLIINLPWFIIALVGSVYYFKLRD